MALQEIGDVRWAEPAIATTSIRCRVAAHARRRSNISRCILDDVRSDDITVSGFGSPVLGVAPFSGRELRGLDSLIAYLDPIGYIARFRQ